MLHRVRGTSYCEMGSLTAATFLARDALIDIETTVTRFAERKTSGNCVLFHIEDRLEDSVFRDDCVVSHQVQQTVRIGEVRILLEQLHRSFATRMTDTHRTCGIKIFLQVTIDIIEICHDNIPIRLIQVDPVRRRVRIATENDSLPDTTDDVVFCANVWSAGKGLHGIFIVVNLLQDFALHPTTRFPPTEKVVQEIFVTTPMVQVACVYLNGVSVGTSPDASEEHGISCNHLYCEEILATFHERAHVCHVLARTLR